MTLFEYIYYRIAKFYFKRDGSAAFGAVTIVSIIQLGLIVDLAIILRNLTDFETEGFVRYGRLIGVIMAGSIIALNFWYFKGKYSKFSNRWRGVEDPKKRKLRGWLVVLSIIAPFALLILLGVIF